MQKIIDKFFSKYYIFSGYLIFSVPFLEFIKENQKSIERIALKEFYLYFFIASILYIILFVVLSKIISSKKLQIIFIYCFSIFFWSLFLFEDLQNFLFYLFMEDASNNLSAEISIGILILFSLLFFNFKFLKLAFNFLIIFFIAQHLIIYANILKNNILVEKKNLEIINKYSNYFSDSEIKLILDNKINNENIYYLVIDNFTSLEQYKNLGGKINTEEFVKFFEDNEYIYVPKTFSSFNSTATTFGSLLNLNPIITDKKDISNDLYFQKTYPNNLSYFYFKTKQYPVLINILNEINYNFIWWGNFKFNCNNYNKFLCIDSNRNIKSDTFNKKINLYILKTFLLNTPLEEILRIVDSKYQVFKKNNLSKDNGNFSIENFISSLKNENKKNKYNFYFVHEIGNTFPIKYDNNCNITASYFLKKNEKHIKDKKSYIENYIASYECYLKKIKNFITFVQKNDPNAIVVIQSDHGARILYENIKDLRRYEIFNLIKVNKDCKKYVSSQIDNINSARLALSCATSAKVKLIDKKTYYTNKINEKNYKIIEIPTK